MAYATILVAAIGGKYHMAIVLPTDERSAGGLFTLSMYLTCAYAINEVYKAKSYSE
jgi:hypothetical protein